MMQLDIISTCIGFLAGTFTGAAGSYFASMFTDQRKKQERTKESAQKFARVSQQMPELIAEMKEDLERNPNTREFFMLLGGGVVGIVQSPYFEYRDSKHPNLKGCMNILENHGYIKDITSTKLPKYRMTEEFVTLLMDSK